MGKKWLATTLLVIAACAVMLRLGLWQLDRLEQRRAFNARVLAQQAAPELILDAGALAQDLAGMEYRAVSVTGTFLSEEEVVLRNQAYGGLPGYRLLTPLRIEGTDTAVLVDRGFVPSEDYTPGDWETYPRPGIVTVLGILRRPQSEADFGGRTDPTPQPGDRLLAWNLANVTAMAGQMSEPLLPVYIQEKPAGEPEAPPSYPVPVVQELELTEGPHLGYAVQWFLFASVLAIGYPFFVRRESEADLAESARSADQDGENK